MKTTLELPADLMRRVRLRAVQRDLKLKDVIAQLLELGMANAPEAEAPARAPSQSDCASTDGSRSPI